MFPPAAYVLIVIFSGVYGRQVVTMQDFNTAQHCEMAHSLVKEKLGDNFVFAVCVDK